MLGVDILLLNNTMSSCIDLITSDLRFNIIIIIFHLVIMTKTVTSVTHIKYII